MSSKLYEFSDPLNNFATFGVPQPTCWRTLSFNINLQTLNNTIFKNMCLQLYKKYIFSSSNVSISVIISSNTIITITRVAIAVIIRKANVYTNHSFERGAEKIIPDIFNLLENKIKTMNPHLFSFDYVSRLSDGFAVCPPHSN
jgi:hypothetical protein